MCSSALGSKRHDGRDVRKEASLPPPGATSAETPKYPRGSTDNELLMNGVRVLTEYGAAQALALYNVIVVRCAGKGFCWPSTRALMSDSGAPCRTVERWRRDLQDAGLITLQRRRNRSAVIRLTKLAGFHLTLERPSLGAAGSDVSKELSTRESGTAKDGGSGTAKGGGTEESNRKLQFPLEAKDKHRARAGARGRRSGGRPPRQREREAMAIVDRLVKNLAEQRAGDQVRAAPLSSRRHEDPALAHAPLKGLRSGPIDWQELRTKPGWAQWEQRQMDHDCEQLGEDHAYHLWLERRPSRAD